MGKSGKSKRRFGDDSHEEQFLPVFYHDLATARFDSGIEGLYVAGLVFMAILGGVVGLVWLLLAATRQVARASMRAYRARKAGVTAGDGMAAERLPINDDVDPATLEEYWVKSFRSPMDTLRVGSLLLDIECKERVRPVFVDGRFVGRSGGMKGWLLANASYIPYQTSMRYKRLAKLYRMALGLAPELPVEWFLPDCTMDAAEINRRIRRFAARLRANPAFEKDEAEAAIAGIGTFTDESLSALRKKGRTFFARRQDSDTAGVEGVTRRLCAALGIYRRPVGPLKRRNAVRTRRPPVFVPTEFRDRAYRDTPKGRINFSVRCTLRRDGRHLKFRGHLTNKLHRELDAKLPDARFAAHFMHSRRLSPLEVDPICNPSAVLA